MHMVSNRILHSTRAVRRAVATHRSAASVDATFVRLSRGPPRFSTISPVNLVWSVCLAIRLDATGRGSLVDHSDSTHELCMPDLHGVEHTGAVSCYWSSSERQAWASSGGAQMAA